MQIKNNGEIFLAGVLLLAPYPSSSKNATNEEGITIARAKQMVTEKGNTFEWQNACLLNYSWCCELVLIKEL